MAGFLRRLTCAGGAAALLVCLTAAGAAQGAQARAAWPAATGRTPSPGHSSFLDGVQALSPSNVWAVGYYCTSKCTTAPVLHGMIVHWNGAAWSRVSSPSVKRSGYLGGVTAVSPSDVLAVGGYSRGALVLRWNGTTWSSMKLSPRGIANLTAVSASSAKNAWAVGYAAGRRSLKTAIIHWNGRAWSRVRSPNPSKSLNMLSAISVYSAKAAWAVGQYCASGCSHGPYVAHGMILHWNGKAWSKAVLPVKNSFDITGVDALSPTDAWAVGTTTRNQLILHWNGRAWSKVTAPLAYPNAVSLNSPASGWAVGGPVFLRWNGTVWQQTATSAPSSSYFSAVSVDGASDAWAVGSYCTSKCAGRRATWGTIAMRWNGATWTRE